MTRRIIEELRRLNESHGFLRGLVAYVGFKQAYVEYDRDVRFTGAGNYNPLTGSLKIGLNFEEAECIITAWIDRYNTERQHSALGYLTPRDWREQFSQLPQAA